MAEPRRYTLDTSAVIAYFGDERGGARVQELLALALAGKANVFVSYIRLKALPIRRVDPSEGLLLRAARIKAEHELSVADAWIAATAMFTESSLVHKDPEFRPLHSRVQLIELPLKGSKRGATT